MTAFVADLAECCVADDDPPNDRSGSVRFRSENLLPERHRRKHEAPSVSSERREEESVRPPADVLWAKVHTFYGQRRCLRYGQDAGVYKAEASVPAHDPQ